MTPESLNQDDVISAKNILSDTSLFQADSLKRALEINMNGRGGSNFVKGFACRLLKPGQQWRSGTIKAKIIIEFYPDEPEPIPSELDDIRNLSS